MRYHLTFERVAMPFYFKVHFVCHPGVVPWSLAAAQVARRWYRPVARVLRAGPGSLDRVAEVLLSSQRDNTHRRCQCDTGTGIGSAI